VLPRVQSSIGSPPVGHSTRGGLRLSGVEQLILTPQTQSVFEKTVACIRPRSPPRVRAHSGFVREPVSLRQDSSFQGALR